MKFIVLLSFLVFANIARADFDLPEQEVLLRNYRSKVVEPTLALDEQRATIDLTFKVYDELYAHTELKQSYFGNRGLDPVSRVAKLQPAGDGAQLLENLTKITMDLRDLHQSFHWPKPFGCLRTFIPMDLGFAYSGPRDQQVFIRKFNTEKLKNKSVESEIEKALAPLSVGDVVLKIDSLPVWFAVENAMLYGGGANEDAYLTEALWAMMWISQHSRGLPAKDVMSFDVRKASGALVHTDVPYLITASDGCLEAKKPTSVELPPLPTFTRSHPLAKDIRASGRTVLPIQKTLPGYTPSEETTIGSAKIHRRSGNYGYLRIEEFSPRDKPVEFAISEIERIAKEFETTTRGLIIDVRNNPGGEYGDVLTQYFSPNHVEAQTEEMRASPSNLALLQAMKDRGEIEDLFVFYLEPVRRALEQGLRYSERLPVNDDQALNGKGRMYTHPVIVLADPNCYSYCDYFTTSMQDNGAAEIWIENGKHTGGGGATVVDYSGLSTFIPATFPAFPQGGDMGIAITSGYRTGKKAGVPIENLGADADRVYRPTMDDARRGDKDLLKALTDRLKEMNSAKPALN